MFKWVKKIKKDAIWESAKRQLLGGELTVQEFVDANSDYPVYYTTPFGEDEKGKTRLWALAFREKGTKHLPVFTEKSFCKKHFEGVGRRNIVIIEGTLEAALRSLDELSEIGQYGLVVDPQMDDPIPIAPGIRVSGDA